MTTFLHDLAAFLALATVVVFILLLYARVKVGSWSAWRDHWRTTGDGAPAGIAMAVVGTILLALAAFWANQAFAEPRWFAYTEVYAGVEATRDRSPMCDPSRVDDRLTSNLGVRQHLYSVTPSVSLLGQYLHHSCAVGVDAEGYDALGLQLQWRFDRN